MKRDGLAIAVERRGTSSRIALRHLSSPWLHVWSAKDHTGGETTHRGVGFRGQTLKTIRTERCLWVPTQASILITPEGPWVLVTVEGQSINFHLDTGATYSVFIESPDPLSPWSTSIMGLFIWNGTVSMSQTLLFQSYSKLQLGLCAFTRVSDHARVSLTPSGEGYTEQGLGLCFREYGACPFSPINWTKCKF